MQTRAMDDAGYNIGFLNEGERQLNKGITMYSSGTTAKEGRKATVSLRNKGYVKRLSSATHAAAWARPARSDEAQRKKQSCTWNRQ